MTRYFVLIRRAAKRENPGLYLMGTRIRLSGNNEYEHYLYGRLRAAAWHLYRQRKVPRAAYEMVASSSRHWTTVYKERSAKHRRFLRGLYESWPGGAPAMSLRRFSAAMNPPIG